MEFYFGLPTLTICKRVPR